MHISIAKAGLRFLNDLFYQQIWVRVKCGMRKIAKRVKCGKVCAERSAFYPLAIFRIPHSAEDGVYMGRWQLICTYMCTRLCLSLYLLVCIMYGGKHMHAVGLYIGIYRAVTSAT